MMEDGKQDTSGPEPAALTDTLASISRVGGKRLLKRAEWSQSLELGIPTIDEQHKRFFELAASFGRDDDEVRVMKTLATLGEYVRSHFREEEILMTIAKYPGREAHGRLHAEFRQMLANLFGRARSMSLDDIADETKYLINGWFYNHIVTVDADYAPFIVPELTAGIDFVTATGSRS